MTHSASSHSTPGDPGDYPEAWLEAKEIVTGLGSRFPVSFTTPIRTLMHDQTKGSTLSPAAQFLTTRLLRSPTFKAMFYYLSLSLFGDKLANSAYLSSSDLVRLYQPQDCASIIGVIYLTRRLQKKRADTLSRWQPALERITVHTEVGGHLGLAIPTIGISRGILTGAMRDLGILSLGRHNREAYASYCEHLNATNKLYDFEYELEHWGCRHIDVAGNVLQQMGFGIKHALSLITGLGNKPPGRPDHDPNAFEFHLSELWINSLVQTQKEPDFTHLGVYYPTEKDKYRLLYEINQLHESGSKHRWLLRSKEDINPQCTPQLYQEFLQELEQSSAIQNFYEENLPADVLKDLSEQDLKALSESDQELE